MRILHIHDTYGVLGGAERYVLETCQGLEQRGHRTVVVTARRVGSSYGMQRSVYIVPRAYGLRSRLRERLWRQYRDILEFERPDLIHVHNTRDFVAPGLLRRLARSVPAVKFVHDVRAFCPTGTKVLPRSQRVCEQRVGRACLNVCECLHGAGVRGSVHALQRYWMTRRDLRFLNECAAVIAGSRYVAAELVRNGCAPWRLRVIPNYTSLAGSPWVEPPAEPVILFLGGFEPIKGALPLLDALGALAGIRWRAIVAGEGSLRERCMQRAAELGIRPRVQFVGRVPDEARATFYHNASVVVMPSLIPEAFGLVGIEAMACGRPVVAFDAGGLGDWLLNGSVGFRVPRGDVGGLAQHLCALLSDRALARSFGLRAYEAARDRYGPAAHLDQLEAVYREAADRCCAPRSAGTPKRTPSQ